MGLLIIIEKWAENLDEATVGKWLKAEGDVVQAGEGVVELITDKATFEWESEQDGILRKVYAAEKSTVPVGYVVGFIGAAGEALPAVEDENARLLAEHQAQARLELQVDASPVAARARGKRVAATPAARRRAREASVELEAVAEFIGEDRRVTEQDVEAFLGRHP